MTVTTQSWKKLFLFCLGLSVGTAFCMKWMEADLWTGNEKFSILGLELFYTKEKLMAILSGLDEHVKTILGYHLSFDFAFMAGIYPGITCLCMIAREKAHRPFLKRMLYVLASVQLLAWAADISENYHLLQWLKNPVITYRQLAIYHVVVWSKWLIALAGVFLSLPWALRRNKR